MRRNSRRVASATSTPIPGLESPIIVHVDYFSHKIEQLTLEEHASQVVAAIAVEETERIAA